MSRRWLRIAHRGASGHAPEHTRVAFERALACGVDMIELDVQLSRDGELIVMHDLELDRTTTGHGPVREHTGTVLRALDAGSWFGPAFAGERVLTLVDVLELVENRCQLNVEIKAPSQDFPALAVNLVRTLRMRSALASTVISSFDPDALGTVRAQDGAVRLGLLWQQVNMDEAWRWARELRAFSVHPHWLLVSPEMVQHAHLSELQLWTWTVNDVEVMRQLVKHGVDGIISDFPDRFRCVEDRGLTPEGKALE